MSYGNYKNETDILVAKKTKYSMHLLKRVYFNLKFAHVSI